MPVSMTPYRVFPDYRHIDPAFFAQHGIRLLQIVLHSVFLLITGILSRNAQKNEPHVQ